MTTSATTPEPRLTSLAHGGGCGCKMAPERLRNILAEMPSAAAFSSLLVGTETSDDAAVWKISEDQAVVATTDFFMPMVDDPFVFGQIAATNALSDVYAMGGRPILALAILGMPINVLSDATIRQVLAGGAEVCGRAGIPVAGGHSIDSVEPIYGLAAIGLVDPARVLTNKGARVGDRLILTKGIGVGVLSAAFKQDRLSDAGYAALVASTTQLNAVGTLLPGTPGVHAVTDVTGFGLLGHALEMARGAGVTVEIDEAAVPMLAGVEALARDGVATGASARNWSSYAEGVVLPDGIEGWRRTLLTDPQTSGGLLIAVAEDRCEAVLDLVRGESFGLAAEIGRIAAGPAVVRVS
ncbi:Selenide, water dikinase [Brevundimonas sp. NIBR10]|uniref:selenide, water dikinase SelD n=1 Tax=Brevundimonas sp. NIBR10 TaxID=3015997 RepID=UPI0022F182D4|nr:selenide, water dikinase SelD [Brevundimonas sp. NIBR10]WGM45551.1 Selenide, water dikinase [Brevundimonas sp. NIBR10]